MGRRGVLEGPMTPKNDCYWVVMTGCPSLGEFTKEGRESREESR